MLKTSTRFGRLFVVFALPMLSVAWSSASSNDLEPSVGSEPDCLMDAVTPAAGGFILDGS